VKFYVVAILFIVFDLETVFLIPWAVAMRELGWSGFAAAIDLHRGADGGADLRMEEGRAPMGLTERPADLPVVGSEAEQGWEPGRAGFLTTRWTSWSTGRVATRCGPCRSGRRAAPSR
jgi:hypothetical protein